MKKTKKSNWERNEYQFPRFIDEAMMAGAFTKEVVRDMATSMDLEPANVYDLINRAQDEWEKIKAKTCPITTVKEG